MHSQLEGLRSITFSITPAHRPSRLKWQWDLGPKLHSIQDFPETIKIVQKQMGSEEQLGPQKEVDETELEDEVEETGGESRFWED